MTEQPNTSPEAPIGGSGASLGQRLWDLAANPVVFVVLSILWCLDLGVGSVMAHLKDPRFWMRMDAYPFNQWLATVAPKTFPESLWVYILTLLTILMVASLALCTLNWFMRRRRRMRGMAEVTLHFGFLLVFAGFLLGSGWGSREQNLNLEAGSTLPLASVEYSLRLDSVEVVRDASGQELDTVSRVALLAPDGSVAAEGVSRINHPLIHGDVVVYPQGGAKENLTALVNVEGMGRLTLPNGRDTVLPDGRALLARFLPAGRNYDAYRGPGFVLGLRNANGTHGGMGFLPLSAGPRLVSVGDLSLSFVTMKKTVGATFNVHRDPGVWYVLAGAAILLFGTLWALLGYLVRPPPAVPGDPNGESQDYALSAVEETEAGEGEGFGFDDENRVK